MSIKVENKSKTVKAMVARRSSMLAHKVVGEFENSKKFKQSGDMLNRIYKKG